MPMLLSMFQFLCPLSCTCPAWGEDESRGPTMKREMTIERLEVLLQCAVMLFK